MAKKQGSSELEHLRGLVRQQKAIIKNLKKEIGRQNKKSHLYDDLDEKLKDLELEEEKIELTSQGNCPECKKGKLSYSDLGIRILTSCGSCKFRESKKK